ncbi:hypothetical protein QVN42_06365 [Yersinia nurmii]|uniref:Type 1 fimbrial protein n=1 Tax=Yersinia nurmii TaxID=685706 RepID=A0AAW7JVK9_9GAMM|nr:hypothetical protein [Yersinia nurmii]MDN0087023.1 hypothetical protein [Yersinia nurmii]CNE15757.1 Uncharacterised protein [Yersinia nurmii]
MGQYRVLSVALVLFSWTALANGAATSGIVRFTGSIVDAPCQIDFSAQTLATRCYSNGKNLSQRQVITAGMDTTSNLPGNLGTSEIQWLNKERNLAIVTINYR